MMLAGQLGVSPQRGVLLPLLQAGGCPADWHTPRGDWSPGNGVLVIHTKNVTFCVPDTCAAAQQISPLKAHLTRS